MDGGRCLVFVVCRAVSACGSGSGVGPGLVSIVVCDSASNCLMSGGKDAFWWKVDVCGVCCLSGFDAWCAAVCVCVLKC